MYDKEVVACHVTGSAKVEPARHVSDDNYGIVLCGLVGIRNKFIGDPYLLLVFCNPHLHLLFPGLLDLFLFCLLGGVA